LEKGRQRELRELFAQHSVGKAEGKKRLKGIKFFITDPSEHDIIPPIVAKLFQQLIINYQNNMGLISCSDKHLQ
ncbi:MAG: hypothetical protein F6K39_27570, partial [Okeania sp. SIO3B3]|nr:hypothetical protein [Okeania sp. SIO3B3]